MPRYVDKPRTVGEAYMACPVWCVVYLDEDWEPDKELEIQDATGQEAWEAVHEYLLARSAAVKGLIPMEGPLARIVAVTVEVPHDGQEANGF